MKILVLTNLLTLHGLGGYEERCLHTVADLRARGHQVHVLTSDHQVDGREATDGQEVSRRLQIHGFYGHPWLPIHQLYRLELANQQILRETLESVRPQVVHVWNMGGISKSLLHTLEAGDVPVVYDISDHWIARSLKADVWLSWWNDPGSPGRALLRGMARLCGLRRVITRQIPTASVRTLQFKKIYFCSKFMRELSQGQGYPVGHAEVVYCGVEVERFRQKTEYSPPTRFIWVGRLAEDKDPMTALKGFLRARSASGWALTLDIFGRGDAAYTAKIEAEIERAAAGDFVCIRAASHEEMRAIYADYDAYIFSSNWGEPFALTPLEAMAAGLPVLMCPDGGDAELLHDGFNALGFVAGSPSSLAGAIQRLLELKDHGKKMSQNARCMVEARFTVTVMTDKIEKILQQAVGLS